MTRKITFAGALLLITLFLALLPSAAHAGGWATVGITELPEEIVAGRPFTLRFMVWQHGNKPVHDLGWAAGERYPVTPQITLTSAQSGETVTAAAVPARQKGLFTAEITLPSAGEWRWSIAPDPLAGVTEFDPLSAQPQTAVSLPAAAGALLPTVPFSGALLALPAVLFFAFTRRAYRGRGV